MATDSNNIQFQPADESDYRSEDVLRFWFPTQPSSDRSTMVCRWDWWFRGGADAAVIAYFLPLLERAARG